MQWRLNWLIQINKLFVLQVKHQFRCVQVQLIAQMHCLEPHHRLNKSQGVLHSTIHQLLYEFDLSDHDAVADKNASSLFQDIRKQIFPLGWLHPLEYQPQQDQDGLKMQYRKPS